MWSPAKKSYSLSPSNLTAIRSAVIAEDNRSPCAEQWLIFNLKKKSLHVIRPRYETLFQPRRSARPFRKKSFTECYTQYNTKCERHPHLELLNFWKSRIRTVIEVFHLLKGEPQTHRTSFFLLPKSNQKVLRPNFSFLSRDAFYSAANATCKHWLVEINIPMFAQWVSVSDSLHWIRRIFFFFDLCLRIFDFWLYSNQMMTTMMCSRT